MASLPGSVDTILLTTTTNAVVGPLAGAAFITKATVLNTTTTNKTVNVWRVPQGGTATTTNELMISALLVAGKQTYVLPISGQALANGASLFASCSATNAMNLNLSYVIPG